MPHVDIRFKEDVISGQQLFAAADQITEIVGQYFQEPAAFVSLEVKPQTAWAKNRKAVDL